jgi:hypothetical protein
VNKLARGKSDRNPHLATALNVNADSSHARGSEGGCELYEVISERGEVNRASGINDPKLREVTTRGEGRGEYHRVEGDTHLVVIAVIRAVLESG